MNQKLQLHTFTEYLLFQKDMIIEEPLIPMNNTHTLVLMTTYVMKA